MQNSAARLAQRLRHGSSLVPLRSVASNFSPRELKPLQGSGSVSGLGCVHRQWEAFSRLKAFGAEISGVVIGLAGVLLGEGGFLFALAA